MLGYNDSNISLQRMMKSLSRRGPDDAGLWIDQEAQIALCHTRLSIIDTSAAGHQPMTHGSGRYWITFNGEIYNYREVLQELGVGADDFHSGTDTEVIIAAFERWGIDALARLRGMFAFALWDRQTRRLYLVRDRLGIKPLLWVETASGLVFASEISTLLASGLVGNVIDPAAVVDLLATGAVLQPRTILRGVQALEPATCLVVAADGLRRSVRYWQPELMAAGLRPELARLPYSELVALTRQKLEEATHYHLVADVPVGSFLSGGFDSTTITALMTARTNRSIQTFSLGFEQQGRDVDELVQARLAAKKFGSIHSELVLTDATVVEYLDDFVDAIDQPSSDGLNTYFVSKLASASVKVALSGLGGDELFGGYSHFPVLAEAESRTGNLTDRLRQALHVLRPNRWTYLSDLRGMSPLAAYTERRRFLSDMELADSLQGIYRQAFHPAFFESHLSADYDMSLDVITRTSTMELKGYLLSTLLRDSDAVSMHHGLEMRPVLLDHPLVEFALALPPDAKLRVRRQKAALVDAARDLLPVELFTRPKSGFTLPLHRWLRTVLRPQMVSCLESPLVGTILNAETRTDLKANIDDPRNVLLLWVLLALWRWVERSNCTVAA